MAVDRLGALSDAGVSIWLDDLSRERLKTGNLAELIRDLHVVGVTTNPTIFATALADGEAYDEQVRELAARGADIDATVREITTTDVRDACDLFRETSQGHRRRGRPGVHRGRPAPRPTTRDKTVAEAKDLWKTVDRPNLFVKIPATEEGVPAIAATLAEGISVNVTLIFSVERYRAVMDAYLEGLEGPRPTATTCRRSPRSRPSSCPVWTARWTSGWTRSAPTRRRRCAARPPSPTRGSPTRPSRRCSPATAGRRSPTPARSRSVHCGPRPASRTPTIRTPCTSTSSSWPTRSTRCPRKPCDAVADHGRMSGDTFPDKVTGTGDEAAKLFADLTAAGIDVDDVYLTLEKRRRGQVREVVERTAGDGVRPARQGREREGLRPAHGSAAQFNRGQRGEHHRRLHSGRAARR